MFLPRSRSREGVVGAEDADRQRAPDAADEVDRDGAHRVVEPCPVDGEDRDDDDDPGRYPRKVPVRDAGTAACF